MNRRCYALALVWLLAPLVALSPAVAQEGPEASSPPPLKRADVRLVVDISGSMRRTDPDNLRRPALSLLVRLLPPESTAGVWTFGQEVNHLIPHQRVDEAWKQRALERVDDINSVALYTNIGAALEQAAYDHDQRGEDLVDIILLTDGVVDVSPDDQVNIREQRRVLNELVPELSAAGYRIHTIALSDEADEDLLRSIARVSDGMFSQARNADDLMDSLLQIFQQAVPAERLPIREGRFLVDPSIEEFTALIRRDDGEPAAVLTDPEGEKYLSQDSRPGVNWHHTKDYDLITVAGPAPGYWELDAELQPHSRLTVISNLQLVVESLPNNVAVGQPLFLEFHLRDNNGLIEDQELLSLLDVELRFRGPDEEQRRSVHWQSEAPMDGRYQMRLPAPTTPGEYQLELTVDGKTFVRLFSHRLAVASQFSVELGKEVDDQRVTWRLSVTAREAVDVQSTSVVAHLRNSRGFSLVKPMESETPGVWQLVVTPEESANYRIGLQASGETTEGSRFEEQLPSQYFSYPEADDPQPAPLEEALSNVRTELDERQSAAERARTGEESALPPSEVRLQTPEPTPEPEPPVTTEPVETQKGLHPAFLYGSLIVANGLLLVLAYFGYRFIMGGKRSEPLPEDDINGDEVGLGAPPPMQQIEPEPEVGLAVDPEPPPARKPPPRNVETDEEDDPLFPLSDDDENRTYDDESPDERK